MKIVVGHLYPDYLNIYADRDVAAVRVDIQVVRVQMPDDDLHAARSQ